MKIRLNLFQVRKLVFVLILVVLAFGGGYWLGEKRVQVPFVSSGSAKVTVEKKEVPADKNVDFSLFWDVWERLDKSFLDKEKIDPQKMVYGAISGMVSSLGDPYTVFLPPPEQKQSKEDLAGSFEGVGISLGLKDSKIAVISPIAGSPAEKSGVKAGDLILRIKDSNARVDKETTGMNLPEAVKLIRGPKGSEVILTLAREGEKEFEVKLTRETIVVKSVELSFQDNVAILKLTKFGERTYQEWEEAINQIEQEKVKNKNFKGVILDLRNNPGGFLQGAVFISSEFLSSGVVVKQEKRDNNGVESFSVDRKGKLLSGSLVVLINQGSASASEIVAGVLQERGRAKLVGEKSFGKGTVQEAEELPDGAGLHITIARWLLPSGKSIDKDGVKPDFEVKMDESDQTKDSQLEKAIELLMK